MLWPLKYLWLCERTFSPDDPSIKESFHKKLEDIKKENPFPKRTAKRKTPDKKGKKKKKKKDKYKKKFDLYY